MAVHKTKTGYQVQWYDADNRFRKRTFRGITREDAVREERKLLAARDRGEPIVDRRLAPTFAVFAAAWVEEHRAGWKQSTREQYEHAIRRWLTPAFGDVRVSDLTESRVRQLIAQLQDAKLSPRRTNYVVLVLRMIVRAAMRRRLLGNDPLAGVRPLRASRARRSTRSAPRRSTHSSRRARLTGGPTSRSPSGPARGRRALRAQDRQPRLEPRQLPHRGGALSRRGGDAEDREQRPRRRHAPPGPGRYSRTGRPAGGPPAPDGAGRSGAGTGLRVHDAERPLSRHQPAARAGVVSDPEAAGLRRRTMYQTRHSFASNALTAGEQPSWVAGMLGHTTPEMLFQVYARYIPNRTRRDGSALLARWGREADAATKAPESERRTPDLLPRDDAKAPEPWMIAALRPGKCERGDLNPHGCYPTGS
jgi:integrase